jgi:hypothetical protein
MERDPDADSNQMGDAADINRTTIAEVMNFEKTEFKYLVNQRTKRPVSNRKDSCG